MLKLTHVNKISQVSAKGEMIEYIPIPQLSYSELKSDFVEAPHLKVIDCLDIKNSNGVFIKCHNQADGLLAAAYLYKKYLEEVSKGFENEDEEDYAYEEFYDDDDDVSDSFDFLSKLPLIHASSFSAAYGGYEPGAINQGFYTLQVKEVFKDSKPYWFHDSFPLIVMETAFNTISLIDSIKCSNRFIIYLSVQSNENMLFNTEYTSRLEKDITFECDFEICQIKPPSEKYYRSVLIQSANEKGYKIAKNISKEQLIENLKLHRRQGFSSNQDIEALVQKAIRKKQTASKTLVQADFDKVLPRQLLLNNDVKLEPSDAVAELEKLIGLNDVKVQLMRIIKLMKFNQKRKSAGFKTSPNHMAAVFMGSPGTAKTTVARIFGKILCEEGVLENETFIEVSRKDLIASYVGQTAPRVSELFKKYEGGTIFIDEAYSLISEGQKDGFSDEAMSEIIRQMENNPNTLVIFAGYLDKMQDFIHEANPGLRSRLTNLITFPNYTIAEMMEIFYYFMNQEDFVLEKPAETKELLDGFIEEVKSFEAENIGNGRMMRKLFNGAIAHMADREDHDMRTIHLSDIEKAASEIIQAEKLLTDSIGHPIGF